MKIKVMGDIHGEFWRISDALKNNTAERIMQVGDFGFMSFRAAHKKSIEDNLKDRNGVEFWFIDGNHDDCSYWTTKTELTKDPLGVDGLVYVPRGYVENIDGVSIAYMGGASSVDKAYRVLNRWHWDPKEDINQEEFNRFEQVKHVDIMFTHIPPQSIIEEYFDRNDLATYFGLPVTWTDPNAVKIQELWERWDYPHIFCGHMHRSVRTNFCTILDISETMTIDTNDYKRTHAETI